MAKYSFGGQHWFNNKHIVSAVLDSLMNVETDNKGFVCIAFLLYLWEYYSISMSRSYGTHDRKQYLVHFFFFYTEKVLWNTTFLMSSELKCKIQWKISSISCTNMSCLTSWTTNSSNSNRSVRVGLKLAPNIQDLMCEKKDVYTITEDS